MDELKRFLDLFEQSGTNKAEQRMRLSEIAETFTLEEIDKLFAQIHPVSERLDVPYIENVPASIKASAFAMEFACICSICNLRADAGNSYYFIHNLDNWEIFKEACFESDWDKRSELLEQIIYDDWEEEL